jgi:hypothetical protein
MKKYLYLLFLIFGLSSFAQVSTGDCNGAIVLCGDLYTEETAPPGTGFEYEYTGVCNQNLETMSLWYTWTVYSPGELSFIITPNDPADDYDWGLFDITTGGCEGIAPGGSSPEVSCNSWGTFAPPNGPTGISTANGGVSNSGGPGNLNGPPFNANLNVLAGHSYALVVMNWSNSQSGYTIDFGESTASLYDQVPPQPISLTADCAHTQFVVTFSELVQTGSAENLDFLLTGPQGEININNVLPLNPQSTLEDEFVIFPSSLITQPGTYTLTITDLSGSVIDACGNATLGTVTIDLGIPLAFDVSSSNACNGLGGTIVVSDVIGNTGDYLIQLNGVVQDDLILENLAPGLYGIALYDESDCVALRQVVISNQIIQVQIPDQDSLSCDDPQLEISGVVVSPNQNATFQWYDITDGFESINQNVINPTINSSGNYLLVVTNESGLCSATDTMQVYATQDNNLSFTFQSNASCNGANGAIEISDASGGLPPYSFLLDDQPADLINQNINPGSHVLQMIDENGCTKVEQIMVDDHLLNVIINDVESLTCLSQSFVVDDIDISPAQDVIYQWFLIDSNLWIEQPATSDNYLVQSAGEYALIVSNQEFGCLDTSFFVVENLIPENYVFDAVVYPACNGVNGSLEIADVQNGTAPFTVFLNGNAQPFLFIDGLASANYNVLVIDAMGCTSSQSVFIPNEVLQVSFDEPDVLACNQDEISIDLPTINPAQLVGYAWYEILPNDDLVLLPFTSGNPTIDEAGDYLVIISSQETGCSVEAIIEVEYNNVSPIVLDAAVTTACNGLGGEADVIANGGQEPYSYNFGGINQLAPLFINLDAGNYTLTVTDADGCENQVNVIIPNHNIEVVIPEQDKITCDDPSTQMEGVVILPPQEVSLSWSYYGNQGWTALGVDDIDPTFSSVGLYALTATNTINGCQASSEIVLDPGELIGVDLSKLVFPNIVTANGDSKNDFWQPYFSYDKSIDIMDIMYQYSLRVFNRWGQLVFESNGSDRGRWNISDENGEGNYYYTLKYSTYCGGFQEGKKEGWIMVVR